MNCVRSAPRTLSICEILQYSLIRTSIEVCVGGMDSSILSLYDDSDDEGAAAYAGNLAPILAELERSNAMRYVLGGSLPGKSANKKRNFQGRWARIYQLYFATNPVYSPEQFRRRFRMRKQLFQRICDTVIAHDNFFQHRRNCTGTLGIHPMMKIIAAFRVLCYGSSADSLDENLEISETVVIQSVKKFTSAVNECFGDYYLRIPTTDDLALLVKENKSRGFPGMVGSLDCMKWVWKNCPTAWAGAFKGMNGKPSVVLEAVASYDLHIWHAFIGMPGACNDINVLDASPLMSEYLDDDAPRFKYSVNGFEYTFPYWLTDGIYPDWRCFVKTISAPIGPKQEYFASSQEAARKDVERAFGVLQARFAIVARPARFWSLKFISQVLKCCIVLHNMIVEDDKTTGRASPLSSYHCKHGRCPESHFAILSPRSSHSNAHIPFDSKFMQVQSNVDHNRLKQDLIHHLWNLRNPS